MSLKPSKPPVGKSKPRRRSTPLKLLKNRLWALCRQITRDRYSNTCYTCGRHGLEGSNWQTGHFIPSSLCSVALRYDLNNLRPQCYHCNINLSGNWPNFEQQLLKEKGSQFISDLKSRNGGTIAHQYGEQWYKLKIEEYKQLLVNKPYAGKEA